MFATLLLTSLGFSNLTEIPCAVDKAQFHRAQTIGIARANSDAPILYCEYHHGLTAEKVQVDYYSPQGNIFAKKLLTYKADLNVPDVLQDDLRSGEQHQISNTTEGWSVRYREHKTANTKETTLTQAEVDVIDAGFDHAVRNYWDLLNSGKVTVVNFASTVFQRSLSLRISKKSSDQCPLATGQNTCLWIEANNALVRLFVDPLQLVYNDQQQLLVFQGVVNIQNDQGKKQTAQIRYYYPCATTLASCDPDKS